MTTVLAIDVSEIAIPFFLNYPRILQSICTYTAQKWNFPLEIPSVNVTKSAVYCGFGHIYWKNP